MKVLTVRLLLPMPLTGVGAFEPSVAGEAGEREDPGVDVGVSTEVVWPGEHEGASFVRAFERFGRRCAEGRGRGRDRGLRRGK